MKVDLLQVHFENSIFDEIVFNIWRFKWVDMFVRINDRSKEAKTFININNDHELTILIKKLFFKFKWVEDALHWPLNFVAFFEMHEKSTDYLSKIEILWKIQHLYIMFGNLSRKTVLF